ncbi:MAG: hypothetical protein GY793_07955 [Proteobacteria bacterium]|nr:hypothetical protein [Pseudomonadota bacterium]
MNKTAFKIIISIFSIIISTESIAISTSSKEKISSDIAMERIQAYAGSSTKSKKVGVLESGTEVIEHKTFLKTNPGLAIMSEPPRDKNVPFDRGSHVYIWEYLEEGYSKVIIHNIPYTTKIARSKTECDRFPPALKYCWAKVLEEPEYYEWKQLSLTEDGQRFWVLNRIIDGSGIISVKDSAVNINRLVNKKTKEKEAEEEKNKPEIEIEKTELLHDPALLKEIKMPKDPMARKFVENMLKSKEQRAKEKKERKKKEAKEKAKSKAKAKKDAEIKTEEDIFKQQKLSDSDLQINFDKPKATLNTMEYINNLNKGETVKLDLKKNQPLILD